MTNPRAIADEAITSIPIIDTHMHLFDTRRPQGVPWPPKGDSIYEPALPERYRRLTGHLGVVGAIEVEASPWLEDNQWVLDIAANESILVGMVGDLEPGKPDFRRQLDRFRKNPLFLGIRYGNIWNRSLAAELSNAAFIEDLKTVSALGLAFDTANPDPELISAAVRLTDLVPDLRVVLDHLPQIKMPSESAASKAVEDDLLRLGERPQVYIKISEVLRRIDGRLETNLDYYREWLDYLWAIFGEDRCMYGSDWPNSDHIATFEQELTLVRQYVMSKGRAAAEKVFWKNSLAAYRWAKRNASQPQL